MTQKYQTVIIGAGPGGYVAALRLGQAKQKVALIENRQLGGTCLNRGCIPTKALLHSSEIAHHIRHAGEHGLRAGDLQVDLPAMMRRKDQVVEKLRGGVGMLLKGRQVDVYPGTGALAGPHQVDVRWENGDRQVLEAEHIVIATGSEPIVPAAFPADRGRVMTSDEILNLQALPKSLLIVGGGYIGCEFATVFSELGCQVTIVEMLDRLLVQCDGDISQMLARQFKKAHLAVHCSTAVDKLEVTESGVRATLAGSNVVEADLALVCTGRRPRSGNLGLQAAGVKTDNKGLIPIDAQCRTNVKNIFAIGDVTGKVQLAHVASRQAAVAAHTILGQPDSEDYAVIPSAIYTHPEIAQVGLTEQQARERSLEVRSAKFPLSASGMALAYGQTAGFVKIVANAEDEIVGAHLMCPHASDLVQEIAVLMKSECTLHELEATIHGHPTFAEALAETAEALLGRPLHAG
ncbi:MAG: dihydrolipoyl dehydrogenase [Sedimentisphaerales bacterium]|nr:dihydrolipoyl dehydrogenase [Sedimentisphaerales bacterium]